MAHITEGHKRRRLKPKQEVIIIYDTDIGFVEHDGIFKEYRSIIYGDVSHEIPVFEYNGKEINGLSCFWVLPIDASTPDLIHKLQYELINLQVKALALGKEMNYQVPQKIKDKEIEQMAEDSIKRIDGIIQKLGYDPRDSTWIEKELAVTERERKWFKFERLSAVVFSQNWDDVTKVYNDQENEDISVYSAKELSKKRMRYILGAYNARMSGDNDVEAWKKEARNFETSHRLRDARMLEWSKSRNGKFPLVRTAKPIVFSPGPYFNECIEKIPHVFTDTSFSRIKPGIILRIVSYDPKLKYILPDFTLDVRKLLKPETDTDKPWIKDAHDYIIWLKPEEIETSLELLEPLS